MFSFNSIISKNKALLLIAILIIFIDLKHSALQYSLTPLDGDLPNICLPVEGYKRVLEDPLGFSVISNKEKYAATNRFTAHYFTYLYFNNVPRFLTKFYNPIESIYASVKFLKLVMHILFLFAVALYANLLSKSNKKRIWLSLLVVMPFMLVYGDFGNSVSFLDHSITYAIFYTLPAVSLLLFYYPLVRIYILKENIKKPFWFYVLWSSLLLLLVFFGPIAPVTVVLISLFYLLFETIQTFFDTHTFNPFRLFFKMIQKCNSTLLFFSIAGIVLGLYSIYIGGFNTENEWCELPLSDRFTALGKGIYETFFDFKKAGFWMLSMVSINSVLLYKTDVLNRKGLILGLLFLFLFLVIYCCLVPFGGCRFYRPNMLRSDISLPMTTLLILFLAYSSQKVFQILKNKYLVAYFIVFALFSIKFFKEDHLPVYTNEIEKKSLYYIKNQSEKGEKEITVPYDHPIIAWSRFDDFQQSKTSSDFIFILKITSRKVLFRNK